MKSNRHAGQFNLQGKKCKVLSCKCCDVVDFRDEYTLKLHTKDMNEIDFLYNDGSNDDDYEQDTQRYA